METQTVTKTEFVGMLIDLAKEMEIKDNVDWNLLDIKEQQVYEMAANSVIDQFYDMPEKQRETVMMASLVKLLHENFVLNLRINGAEVSKK